MNEDNVEAVLVDGDKEVLIDYIKEIKTPNVYLEIGTWEGGSALLARNANPDIDIYTIDITDERYKLYHRKDINFIKGYSVEVAKTWNKPIQVLFIDGEHDTEVENDFWAWEKYVVPGGIICFHDYAVHSPGVVNACDTLFKNNPNYKILFVPDSSPARTGPTSIYQVRKLGAR